MSEFPLTPSSSDPDDNSSRKEIVVQQKALLPDRIRIPAPEEKDLDDSKQQ